MSETTKTIAFRVSTEADEQIQQRAIFARQNKSEWVRDQVMAALHGPAFKTNSSAESHDTNQIDKPLEVRYVELEYQFRESMFFAVESVLSGLQGLIANAPTGTSLGIPFDEATARRAEGQASQLFVSLSELRLSDPNGADAA